MYKTVLVNSDVENGRRIVERLEEKGWQITAAFWFHPEEEDRWQLIIVSPDVSDKGPRQLYTTLWKLLDDFSNDPQNPFKFPLDDIKVIGPYSLLYKMVKERSGAVPKDYSLEDAYIYKMT
jgi:hypothetical protein